ncbi:glycoside hydrolase family 3 N-terminal domain-containing protein [Streptomyces marispadix]|uniref:beta-glucosidase n=1 Tax=Streptomyces marispadix TaxID=2922868 RepID=A0ABS9SSA4_9ACTN|nr:glycoside hydrolase family 3 N-terminal domain-containing protein [Streptomyces marispadix]MCH6159073.1 glycoside hydrolase family 3 C-terminal domain-containing protein [Streptomyces marispadix]
MTVEEKLGQLQQLTWNPDTGPGEGQNEKAREAAAKGRLGSVLNITGAKECNDLQRFAVEESRLGIPLVFGLDVIHGFLTTFPVPLAQGASFDPAVVAADAEVSAREAASWGVHWTFAPMADVSREPRWGRIAEGSGEDPYLTAELTAAKVRGYQGDDYSEEGRIAACAKHFVGYGFPEGGRDYNTVDISERRLRDVALPPFKAAVDAGVATVMASFNTVNGVPAHANPHTLTGILHEEFGFDGFVVGDYNGVQELIPHGVAADGSDAAALALGAGVDMEMVSTTYADHGKELLESGRLDMERLDDAVTRVLRVKARLGLFENPYTDEDGEIAKPTRTARRRAREAAARCAVLLKNDERTLPFGKDTASLAVVGPLGDDTQELHGTWAGPGSRMFPAVSVLEGVKKAVPDAKVTFARGCAVTGDDTGGFEKAEAVVRAADAAVVVVGEKASHSGEAASRSDIRLPGVQEELIRRIARTGKPFAVVVLAGRPLVLSGIVEQAPAVLAGWHPGLEGGNAVADVLFGEVNPGGKLPVTLPRAVGQLAEYYAHENTGRPYDPDNKYTSKYLDLAHGPLFPFGHGLSYTTFGYSRLELSDESVSAKAVRDGHAKVGVTVRVENTGRRKGDEVVQLYIRDKVASIAQPVRRLRGFERVALEPGESRTVSFELGADDLGFHTNDPSGELLVEAGEFTVYAGGSSEAELHTKLTLT